MKFNCGTETLDVGYIRSNVLTYRNQHPETLYEDLYLIMNNETLNQLKSQCVHDSSFLISSTFTPMFMGYYIATCNKLKYGEIEIR